MTIEDILEKFTIDEIQEKFLSVANEIMYSLDDECYVPYFVNVIPAEYLKKIVHYYPAEILEESSSEEEIVETFINENIHDIFEKVYIQLGIKPENIKFIYDVNNELFDKFDYDTVINSLIESMKRFLNEKNNDIYEYLKKIRLIDARLDTEDIVNLNDTIGDSTTIKHLDFDTREAALIDIDGTVLIGGDGQSHAEVLQTYLDDISFETGEELELSNKWSRPKLREVENLLNNQYCAFGHILDNNIFIETYTLEDVSINEIISDINNAGIDYNKIYEYENNEITRIAKVIK